MTCIYACQHHWRVQTSSIIKVETADFVSNSFNSDPPPGQLSSNSVFIGKQNPELCQLSFICVHSQHLALVPNHPSRDTTAAPEGLPHSTSSARMLMSLLFYSSAALGPWFLSNHHDCEHCDPGACGYGCQNFRGTFSRWLDRTFGRSAGQKPSQKNTEANVDIMFSHGFNIEPCFYSWMNLNALLFNFRWKVCI